MSMTVQAGRVGHGAKVHRVSEMQNKFGDTYLYVACGSNQKARSHVRKVEGGLDAITCPRCRKSAESYVAYYESQGGN